MVVCVVNYISSRFHVEHQLIFIINIQNNNILTRCSKCLSVNTRLHDHSFPSKTLSQL